MIDNEDERDALHATVQPKVEQSKTDQKVWRTQKKRGHTDRWEEGALKLCVDHVVFTPTDADDELDSNSIAVPYAHLTV